MSQEISTGITGGGTGPLSRPQKSERKESISPGVQGTANKPVNQGRDDWNSSAIQELAIPLISPLTQSSTVDPKKEGDGYKITDDRVLHVLGSSNTGVSISLPNEGIKSISIEGTPELLANITELDLHENQLTEIPKDIGKLTQLKLLRLDSNQLDGSIPDTIGNLTQLTNLELENNQLDGSIPVEIGNLTQLKTLRLDSNQLDGSIPTEIGNLTNLTFFLLQGNQLSGSIPTEIENLTNLQELWLNHNELSGRIPTEIGNLTNLKKLSLDHNRLNGSIPTQIGNLTQLTDFRFDGNPDLDLAAGTWKYIDATAPLKMEQTKKAG